MINAPYPELNEVITHIGQAGKHLADIKACEGAAGNISVCMRWPVEVRNFFPIANPYELPLAVPGLAGATVIVSGSGRRLREIIDDPAANLAAVVVGENGKSSTIFTSPACLFQRPTSEFNSHLAVHLDQMRISGSNFLAVIHAQPIHLTYLSQVPRYQDEKYLSTHLLRWQPESIANFPTGIGFLPFAVPGTSDLMEGNVQSLRNHNLVIWAKHGVMTFSDISVKRAADRIEYAETGAKYECLNLSLGEIGTGLTAEEVREICRTSKIEQTVF